MSNALAAVESARTALDVQDKKLALARRRNEIGVGTDLELWNRKQKTAQARDISKSFCRLSNARVTLAQALGHMESLVNKT